MSGLLLRVAGVEEALREVKAKFESTVETIANAADELMRRIREDGVQLLEDKAEAAVIRTIEGLEVKGESMLVNIAAKFTELEARVGVLEERIALVEAAIEDSPTAGEGD